VIPLEICVGGEKNWDVRFSKATKGFRDGAMNYGTEVRRAIEVIRNSKAAELGKQSVWLRWNLPECRIPWSELCTTDQFRISFLLRRCHIL
jgi:hypothetical protein